MLNHIWYISDVYYAVDRLSLLTCSRVFLSYSVMFLNVLYMYTVMLCGSYNKQVI